MQTVAKVYALNRMFANHRGTTLNYEDLRKYLFGQNDGVREELEELEGSNTANEALDAYGDAITFIDGLLFKAGVTKDVAVNMEAAFNKEARACRQAGLLPRAIDAAVYTHNPSLPRHMCGSTVVALFAEYKPANYLPTFDKYCAWIQSCDGTEATTISDDLASEYLRTFTVIVWAYYRTVIEHARSMTLFNMSAAYDKVHESNVSKLCWSPEERDASIADYCSRYDLPEDAFKFDECQSDDGRTYYVIRTARDVIFKKPDGDKFVPQGKFLKSINFVEPVFDCPPVWSTKFNVEDCQFSIATKWSHAPKMDL